MGDSGVHNEGIDARLQAGDSGVGSAAFVALAVQYSVVETGAEDYEELYSQRSRLYQFQDREWKECGLGYAKLLKHKQTGKVRFMLQQDKTMKVVCNLFVVAHETYYNLQPNVGSETCLSWCANDDAGDEPVHFALKFARADLAK